jgi:cell division transport system permease protein
MSVLTLAAALGVSGLLGLLAWNAHQTLGELQRNLAIEAFFNPVISSDEAATTATNEVPKIPGVSNYTIISKEQALESYRASSGEDVQAVLGLNPLPASVTVYLAEPSSASADRVQTRLRAIAGITDVRSDEALLKTTELRAHAIDRLAIIIGALLLLTAILFIANSARLLLRMRQDGIHTLALMGATRWQMIGPFLLEAGISGLIGGIIATAIALLLSHQTFAALGGGVDLTNSSRQVLRMLWALSLSGTLLASLTMLGVALSRARRF